MPDISTVKLPGDNQTYYIKDSTARTQIAGKADASHTHTVSEVTDFPSNNVTGSGTSGYLTKWNGTNTITNGPQLGSSTTKYLRNDGTWDTPPGTAMVTWRPIQVDSTDFLNSVPGDTTRILNLKAGSNVTLTPGTGNGDVTIASTDTNTWRPVWVDGAVLLADTSRPLNLVPGSNVTLTGTAQSGQVTIAASDTNTWRNLTVNGSSWKGTGTGTGAANFKAGTNVTLTKSGNDLTIAASLPSGGMQFKGSDTEANIKAKTNQTAGSIWLATDTHEEWLATEDIGSTADATKWEKLGGAYGALAYADTASGSITPSGSIAAGTGTSAPGTTTVYSITATGSLPSHGNDSFSAGTLPTHSADSFTQGSFTSGTFSAGSLPSWTASVDNEILTIGWSAGTLPSHGADSFTKPTFTQGTFSKGTLPSFTQGTFSAGTLPTKGSAQTVLTSIGTPTFTGTAASVTVTPDE